MPLETFNPSIRPSQGTKFQPKVNLNEADFGDGYSKRSPRGLNHINQNISLRWDGLTQEQYTELAEFFEGKGGFRPFYYLPRGKHAPLKFTCKEWNGSDSSPWTFDAKFEQSFTTEE